MVGVVFAATCALLLGGSGFAVAAVPAFGSAQTYPTVATGWGTSPGSVAAGDVNGDSCPDAVVTNGITGASGYSLSVLPGIRTDGACTGALGVPAAVAIATAPQDLKLGDLNTDGCLDIVASTTLYVYRFLNVKTGGVCTGAFGAAARKSTISGKGIDIRDLDVDGCLDVVVGNWQNWTFPSEVSVLLGLKTGGSCNGTFGSRADIDTGSDYPTGRGSQNLTTGDMNGDSCPDIVSANRRSYDSFSVMMQTKAGGVCTGVFTTGVPYVGTVSFGAQGVTIGDFNADGFADIAGSTTEGDSAPFEVFLGSNGLNGAIGSLQGGGHATSYAAIPFSNPERVQNADLNGDGKLDLVGSYFSYGSLSVFPGNGDGTFAPRIDLSNGVVLSTSSGGLAIADMDSDGQPDLLTTVSGGGANAVGVFINAYEPPIPPAPPTPPTSDGNSGDPLGAGPVVGGVITGSDESLGIIRPASRRNRVTMIQRHRGPRLIAALRDSFDIKVPGRYTLMYVRPNGMRAMVNSETAIGSRTIHRPMSAPVVHVTDTSRALRVTAFISPGLVKQGLTLRLILRDPDGTLTGMDLPALG